MVMAAVTVPVTFPLNPGRSNTRAGSNPSIWPFTFADSVPFAMCASYPKSGRRPPRISESFSLPEASKVIVAIVESSGRRDAGPRGMCPFTSNVPLRRLAYSGFAKAVRTNARPMRSMSRFATVPRAV